MGDNLALGDILTKEEVVKIKVKDADGKETEKRVVLRKLGQGVQTKIRQSPDIGTPTFYYSMKDNMPDLTLEDCENIDNDFAIQLLNEINRINGWTKESIEAKGKNSEPSSEQGKGNSQKN